MAIVKINYINAYKICHCNFSMIFSIFFNYKKYIKSTLKSTLKYSLDILNDLKDILIFPIYFKCPSHLYFLFKIKFKKWHIQKNTSYLSPKGETASIFIVGRSMIYQ